MVADAPRDDLKAPPAMPVLLAFVAGAVDACTFLALFGVFVAQLTGSFVVVGAQLVRRDPAALIHLLAFPVFFVGGAAIALLLQGRGARGLAPALAIETALLAAFAAVGLAAAPFASPGAPAAILASGLGLLAMGVQSATVRLLLPGTASTNVMTNNTTQLAIDVAQWLLGALRPASAASRAVAAGRIAVLAPVMAGFLAGSAAGAIGFMLAGFWSLLPVIGILAWLAGSAWARSRTT